MSICPCWLKVMYQPRLSVCKSRICLVVMINADVLLASSSRLIFGGQVIAFEFTKKSLFAVKETL